jgi:hypothetical protein
MSSKQYLCTRQVGSMEGMEGMERVEDAEKYGVREDRKCGATGSARVWLGRFARLASVQGRQSSVNS